MSQALNKIKEIYVVGAAKNYELTSQIIARSKLSNIKEISEEEYLFEIEKNTNKTSNALALKVHKGEFARACPATKSPYLCCQYEIISPFQNCTIGCHYCVLQQYLSENCNVVYVDTENIVDEALARYQTLNRKLIRVGTGELGDSLLFEPWTLEGVRLAQAFSKYDHIMFELKTKTVNIETLLEIEPPKNCVIAWSLNPQTLIDKYEPLASSLEERIAAAKIVSEKGYRIAFHFDPIIEIENGEQLYAEVIKQLSENLSAEKIAWISMGTLRFPPEFSETISAKYHNSKLFSGEMIRSLDSKIRYLRSLRINLYKWVATPLQKYLPHVFKYMCMEQATVWQKVFGAAPCDNEELDAWFAAAVKNNVNSIK